MPGWKRVKTNIATAKPPPDDVGLELPRTVDVWDFTTLKHCFSRGVDHTHVLNIAFSPDDRTLALWPVEESAGCRDETTGRIGHTKMDIGAFENLPPPPKS
jgi:hypothetical protein